MSTSDALDTEISTIHDQIAALRAQRDNLTSVLLSTPHLSTRLDQRPVKHERLRRNVADLARKQSLRNQENTYRACAGVTAYKVQDPDPNAVDSGNILGVRIEVFVEGRFVDTYHVLFNRPSARHQAMLKIHRHTIPPCIPVRQLAAKYLPLSQRDATKMVEQDLIRFGRVLRKELVAWHLRTAAVERLRADAGVDKLKEDEPMYGTVLNNFGEKNSKGKAITPNAFVSDEEEEEDPDADYAESRRRSAPVKITDIEADMAVRQIQISWSNGQTAVVEVTKDGEITRGVVRTGEGIRVSALERKLAGKIEGLLGKLAS